MRTIQDAWDWYLAARDQFRRMRRLAERYWDELPWEGRLGRDDLFRSLDNKDLIAEADVGLGELNDLAVLLLFSVFEAQVRQFVHDQVQAEAASLRHPALVQAAEETVQRIDEGSFFRVLEAYKIADADVVEQVNQVRRYRNWVAHGRRGASPITLDPPEAIRRLRLFLKALGISAA